MAQRYAFADALGEKAAKHELEQREKVVRREKELARKKEEERKELCKVLKDWWDGWKPKLEAEVASGAVCPSTNLVLPLSVREYNNPDADGIKQALPEELLRGFQLVRVDWYCNKSLAVIEIDISQEKAKALRRMEAEGSKSAAGLAANKKAKTEAKAEVKTEVKTEVKAEVKAE